jgi:hypothetical protein
MDKRKKAKKKPVDPEIAEWEARSEERYKLIIRYLKRREDELRQRLEAEP